MTSGDSRASSTLRVVLADDHPLMREGVRRILSDSNDLDVVGVAEDGFSALALIRQFKPRVAVVDLTMPGLSGMNLVRRIRTEHPQTAVLVLSMHTEQQYAMRALKSGAHGYLSKDAAAEELLQAVRKVATGGCYLSRGMAEQVAMSLAHHDDGPRHEQLTDREFEVFRLIVAGKRLTDIAQSLHLSIKTVSTHKSRLLQKMQLDSTAALIRYGLQHRLFAESNGTGDNAQGRDPDPHSGLTEHSTLPVPARAKPAVVGPDDATSAHSTPVVGEQSSLGF